MVMVTVRVMVRFRIRIVFRGSGYLDTMGLLAMHNSPMPTYSPTHTHSRRYAHHTHALNRNHAHHR